MTNPNDKVGNTWQAGEETEAERERREQDERDAEIEQSEIDWSVAWEREREDYV